MTQEHISIFHNPPDTADKVATNDCDMCGDSIDKELDEYMTYAGDLICEDCTNEHFVFIERIGEYVPIEDAVFTQDTQKWYLADDHLVYRCGDCDLWYAHSHTGAFSVDNDYQTICEDCCQGGDYSYCEDIEQYAHVENCYYSEDTGSCYFYEDNLPGPQNGGLYCYSSNVLEIIGRQCYVNGSETYQFGQHLVMGVELETDDRCVSNIVETLDEETDIHSYAICKSDATCSGPEIVTLPADLASHKSVYSWDSWCAVLRPIARGYHGGDNGIHIHINRAALAATTLGKMLVFMNHQDNRQFVEVIAQRSLNGWCTTNGHKYTSVAKSAVEPADGKYSAINVTRETAELRIFNSTLLEQRIYKNLEFCDALARFCMLPSANHREDYMLPHKFIRYVRDNNVTYPYLSEFINNRWQ
jgi:hypothetical protein